MFARRYAVVVCQTPSLKQIVLRRLARHPCISPGIVRRLGAKPVHLQKQFAPMATTPLVNIHCILHPMAEA